MTIHPATGKDIHSILDYWYSLDAAAMKAMGASIHNLPTRDDFQKSLALQFVLPLEERKAYCLIWKLGEEAIGHCNTNPTFYGDHAFMHLHIWKAKHRSQGYGSQFVKLSIPHFFETLKLKVLHSQPYAENAASSRTLEKAGFKYTGEKTCTPGSLSFEQQVKCWEIREVASD